MHVSINEEFLDKTRKEAKANGEPGMLEYGSKALYDKITEMQVTDDFAYYTIRNELGVFFIQIPLDNKFFSLALPIVIKQMNKIKTLIESLK